MVKLLTYTKSELFCIDLFKIKLLYFSFPRRVICLTSFLCKSELFYTNLSKVEFSYFSFPNEVTCLISPLYTLIALIFGHFRFIQKFFIFSKGTILNRNPKDDFTPAKGLKCSFFLLAA